MLEPDARAPDKALLRDVIVEAGALARDYYERGVKAWAKSKGEAVTEADIAIDRLIRARLSAERPDDGLLSEETRDDPARLSKPRVWIIDPIDGTIAFIKRRPHFTVCIALVESGRPVLGAVLNPLMDELFAAEAGAGATLNGLAIHVSDTAQIAGCRMLGSKDMFAHPAWPEPWPPMTVEGRNSIAYRMSLVASGAFDGAIALSRKAEWDLAAADLIVTEAGGCVTTHTGEKFRYNSRTALAPSLVCAGPRLHALLLERVRHVSLP